jgi:hypothetical protein
MHEDLWAVSDMFFGVDPFEEVIDQVYHLVDSRDIELRVGQHLSMSRVPLQHSISTDTDTIIRLRTNNDLHSVWMAYLVSERKQFLTRTQNDVQLIA